MSDDPVDSLEFVSNMKMGLDNRENMHYNVSNFTETG